MRLTYQTSVATFIQFVIVSLFTLLSQIISTISSCRQSSSDCIGNLSLSIIFYIVIAVVFGVIWLIGYAAQARRSRNLARLLIAIEGFLALLALFSIKLNANSRSASGLFASFGMLILSAWIISLSFRLMRAGSGRVVNRQRRRPS